MEKKRCLSVYGIPRGRSTWSNWCHVIKKTYATGDTDRIWTSRASSVTVTRGFQNTVTKSEFRTQVECILLFGKASNNYSSLLRPQRPLRVTQRTTHRTFCDHQSYRKSYSHVVKSHVGIGTTRSCRVTRRAISSVICWKCDTKKNETTRKVWYHRSNPSTLSLFRVFGLTGRCIATYARRDWLRELEFQPITQHILVMLSTTPSNRK
jgi:hypothetical protein